MKTAAHRKTDAAGKQSGRHGTKSARPFFGAAKSAAVQARLQLGRPGDAYEVEADRVADRVVAGKPAAGRIGLAATVTPITQRREEEPQANAKQAPPRLKSVDEEAVRAQPDEEQQVQTDEALQTQEEEEEVQAREEEEEEEVQAREEEEVQAREEEEVQAQEEEEVQAQEEEEVQAQEEEEEIQAQSEEEEEEVQAQPEEEEEEVQAREEEEEVQTRSSTNRSLRVSDEVSRQVRAAKGRGNPLPGPVRDKMEARFGADFSGVRIHTDSLAVQLSRALGAQAFTRGSDIFFNQGKFATGSRSGEHLLAHELTHTVQQGAVEPDGARTLRLEPEPEPNGDDSYELRPELVEAIRLARGEIGKVNAKVHGGDGKRLGWKQLRAYFNTALGGPVIHESIIDKITLVSFPGQQGKKDALPSWCGIFTWWAMKTAGLPVPDWKLGGPVLDSLKVRPPGELPRKGDIAIDVFPYNHFAMVTGLESSKDAEGKPKKLTRIATINGNTAGEDNLGGQVQEKWHTLDHWDHFFDPVGKMNLPDVPLVTVSREVEPIDPGAQATAPAPVVEEQETGDREQLAGLKTETEPPAPETAGQLPEPDLSLPPPADPGPAEQVAAVAEVDFGKTSDGAAGAYLDASPSSMAVSQPGFAPAVDGKMKSEQQELVDNPPQLAARTSGAVDAPITGADELPIPGDARLDDGIKGQDAGAIDQVSAAAPAPFRGNAERDRELDKEDSGSFWDRFKTFLRSFVSGIKTRDGSIDTSAGKAEKVDLSGAAGAERMDTQRTQGTEQMTVQRDAQTKSFHENPGQKNIQPRMIDETRAARVSAEPAADVKLDSDAGMADYARAPFPEDVRAAADAKIAAKLNPNLADARGQVTQAAAARDTDKKQKTDAAQEAAATLNTETDAAQRKLVVDNRGKVAKLQGEGIGSAYEQVNEFSKDAAGRQTTARREIGDHVKSEEGKARDKLAEGERDAEKKKKEGEEEAAVKKAELKKEQNKGSWWDRVKSAIKKAVKVITDAIDTIFTALRKAVKFIIEKAKNAAIGLINKARNWVVDKIDKFRTWAKDKVNTYLKDRFPNLARRINNGIDAVADTAIKGVNAVADAAIKTVTAIADGLAAALDKILATFQTAMKTAVRVAGAVLQGDFAEALRAAIEGACEIAGINPKPVFDFFDRAGKAVMAILKDPVKFIKNLFSAVGAGMSNFFSNIKKHLISGVIGWLTGALSEVNLTGPFEFSARGILKIVLEVLGLTYANIKARVIRRYPKAEKVFDVVEKGFALVKRLITEGPMALWDEIKKSLSNLKEMVMGAIRNWLIVTAIREGMVWLLSLTNPASAIVKAIKLVFDLVMFLVERFQQIKEFVMSVYAAVAAMAAGNFAKVTKAVEDALARSIPVLISLFASILGLGGIAKQVKKIIQTVTKPINKVIDKVVDKIIAFVKKVLGKAKAGAKKAKKKVKETIQKIANWWKEKRKFKSKDGGSHSIYYRGQGKQADLLVASDPDKIEKFLNAKLKDAAAPADQKAIAQEALTQYKLVLKSEDDLEKLRSARSAISSTDKAQYRKATSAVNSEIRQFRNRLDALKKILEKATFESEDDALVRTHVAHNAGGDKSTIALPLTYLSGNEKGSSPFQDPPGWDHAVDLDTKPDGSSRNQWVRGHLLNDNLHGPGKANNLVPITQSMNRKMEADVESPAKSAIKTRGKLFFYKTVVSYWKKPAPIDVFPQKIVVTWGQAKRDTGDKTKFVEATANTPTKIEMGTAPPATASSFVPSINDGSPGLLLKAFNKHDSSVTSYFVSEILLGEFNDNGRYSSKTDMKTRLWIKAGAALASKRRKHVNAVYNAITAGDARV